MSRRLTSALIVLLGLALLPNLADGRKRRRAKRSARLLEAKQRARHRLPLETRQNPVKLLPGGARGKVVIGVMGSAAPEKTIAKELHGRLRTLGATIAKRGAVVLTGACPGMPQVTARAAKRAGGYTVGISPASSLKEHIGTFHSPTKSLDVIQMTSAGPGMGFIAREKQNIQHSDILMFAGGRSGTLGEIVFALQEPKVVALLEDSTGVTAAAKKKILPHIGTGKAVLVSDRDPKRLVDKALAAHAMLRKKQPTRKVQATIEKLGDALVRPDVQAKLIKRRLKKPVEMHRKPVITAQVKQDKNIYAFFGTSSRMKRDDKRKVMQLTKLIARDTTGGRKPMLVVPTRPGLPATIAQIAHGLGAKTLGISPAWSQRLHKAAKQSTAGLDQVRLTGEGTRGIGRLAAYRHAIENADVVFVAGGDHRTLGGTVFAMYQPTVVAVLETAGMSKSLRKISATYDKPAYAKMIYDSDPTRLYRRAVKAAAELRTQQKAQYIAPE
jgi:uncharacterized protein (TIGR00725 family)